MLYRITSITDLDGNDRLDGRYPLRIGRTFRFCQPPKVGSCLFIAYEKNADGSPYPGIFRTSRVSHLFFDNDSIVATTYNSIYTFEKEAC